MAKTTAWDATKRTKRVDESTEMQRKWKCSVGKKVSEKSSRTVLWAVSPPEVAGGPGIAW